MMHKNILKIMNGSLFESHETAYTLTMWHSKAESDALLPNRTYISLIEIKYKSCLT